MDSSTSAYIAAGILLCVSVLASKAATRVGIPLLVVFLGIGMLGGSFGLSFHNYHAVQNLSVLALISILFSGGLDTDLASVKKVFWSGLVLSTFGVLITTVVVGFFGAAFLHLDRLEALLLAAIVAATDVAAVFTVLRARNVGLNPRIKTLLEFESAVNDPTTVFLSVGILELYSTGQSSFSSLVPQFFIQMGLGLAMGWLFARFFVWMVNRLKLEFEGLYPVLTISMVLLIYGITEHLGGSGFLAVYVSGIVLGNQVFTKKESLVQFHDGIAWLMQIAMFLTMGLLVAPAELGRVALAGLALSAFLVFVARPTSVFLCLFPFRFDFREKAMISWGGLRGAVPIILATFPLVRGVRDAQTIFHLVFFVVCTSVLLQGTFVPFFAKRLRVVS